MSSISNSVRASTLLAALLIASLAYLPSATAQQERVRVTVMTPAIAFVGQKINIFIETAFAGSLVDAQIQGPHVWKPDNSRDNLPDATRFATGHFSIPYTVPNMVGTYWVHVRATSNATSNYGSWSFQVNPQIPSTGNFEGLAQKSDLSSLMNEFTSLKRSMEATQSQGTLVQATLALVVIVLVLQIVSLVRKR